MSSLKQVLVKNATAMTLHERFTKIRKNKEATSNERVKAQLVSSKNRRLAQQMEKRPAVAAALRRDSIKSRLGLPGAISVRDRLRYPRAFTLRRGRGGFLTGKSPLTRGLARLNSMDVDMPLVPRRSRSPFVANKVAAQRRSRSRSRSRGPPMRSRSQSRTRPANNVRFRGRSRSRSRARFGSTPSLRGQFSTRRANYRRGRGFGLRRFRNDLKSFRPKLTAAGTRATSFRGGNRGRGSAGRGRGGRGKLQNRQNRQLPSKEQLDRELDQYMSTTKASLDKELDDMMNQEKWD